MSTKRTLTATAPDGQTVTANVGPTRTVGAIRIMDTTGFTGCDPTDRWLVTVHKTLTNAVTGPNQTPAWNGHTRYAVAIGTDDQPVGRWVPCTK